MSRDTPPHLSSSGRGDDTDPSALPDLTDPDGPAFDAIDVPETSDELAAFEQRRRIYPRSSASSSSDGSVAAAYHTVHAVPRAHHDTLPNDRPSAPVVVRPVTAPGHDRANPPPPPAPAADDAPALEAHAGRDVSTFPLPRRSPGARALPVAAAAALVTAGLVALVLVRAGGTEPSPAAGSAARAIASVTSRALAPSAAAAVSAPLLASAAASVSTSPSASARSVAEPAATATATPASPQRAKSAAPLPVRPGGQPVSRPASSSSSTTPASARPAGDFDDLVREGKP